MKKTLSVILIVFLLSLSLSIFQALHLPSNTSFAQSQGFNNPASTTNTDGEEQAVTSTNDAIIKSILIIAQVSVLGIIFNHIFFQMILKKKKINQINDMENKCGFIYDNISYEKRFTKIVLLCSVFIILASTGTILLQAYELSQQLQFDISTAFSILFSASVGQVWIIRLATSLLVAGLVIAYYPLKKRENFKDNQKQKDNNKKIIITYDIRKSAIVLYILIFVSSMNLFSNSMIGHSNALKLFSSLAVSVDFIHFIAVSLWIGGLFYISTLLLIRNKKSSVNNSDYTSLNTNFNNDNDDKKSTRNTVQISILLTYFSFIAILSLIIIGITGLYLALIHLQSLDAIFNTLYGNILIIKLSLAFPMILIGRYNQIKIQDYIKLTKDIVTSNKSNTNQDSNIFKKDNKKRDDLINGVKKSIKIESLIGISVLIAASFLSITSPPSLATTTTANQRINESNTGANISTNTNNMDFYAMFVILSIIIIMVGIIKFRKNQQKVKDIYVPNQNDWSL